MAAGQESVFMQSYAVVSSRVPESRSRMEGIAACGKGYVEGLW